MQDILTLSCPALKGTTRVVGFRGTERISAPYELAIDVVVSRSGEEDFDGAMLEPATLTLDRADGRPPLRWHGVVASIDDVQEYIDGSLCTLLLVPRLWKLTLTQHSRIFVDEPTPKIIDAILKQNGFSPSDYELRLAEKYGPREHVCQYLESDFAFLSRWMEREGIYYFFEQGDDVEKLVITDSAAYQKDFTTEALRYVPSAPSGGSFKRTESIDAFACKQVASPSRVRVKDYDYNRPDLDVAGAADVASRGFGEVRLWGENVTTVDEAKRLAKVRAEEIAARRRVFDGSGNAPYLRSGYTFELEEHPRAAYNAKYLVVAIEHIFNQSAHALGVQDVLGYSSDEVYRSTIAAIPASVQFRPERATARPQIDGIITATIDGPADSKYAQIDKHGRYKVRVKFDEGDLADGKASMFVRMLQPHGGSPEGFHFPLRKGAEVQLLFLGGDPDRPVIGAVAPNAQKPSVVTGENHTKNVIHTGGNNRFELEDADEHQHIHLSTPTKRTFMYMGAGRGGAGAKSSGVFRDPLMQAPADADGAGGDPPQTYHFICSTDGSTLMTADKNFTLHAGADEWIKIDGAKTEDVAKVVEQDYHNDHSLTIDGKQFERVAHKRTSIVGSLDATVVHDAELTFNGDRTQTVSGDTIESYTGTWTSTHDGLRSVEANAGAVEIIKGRWFQHVKGPATQSIDASLTQSIGTFLQQTVGGDYDLHVTGHFNPTVDGDLKWLTLGQKFSVTMANLTDVSVGVKESLAYSAEFKFGLSATLDLTEGIDVKIKQAPYLQSLQNDISSAVAKIIHADMVIVP